ncbi:MAG: response regulator, partial [Gemmatimonadaceae bacterium]|nr:response regulator [Gloeobacterales cyanobacterium ES-bin-141]
EGNLTPKQVEFARTILGSGHDLLRLINDVLDLSKIESGNFTISVADVRLKDLVENVDRTFRHIAQEKGIDFIFDLAPNLPEMICTDEQRLDQVLKNLVSNALKFTDRGQVSFKVAAVESGWSHDRFLLSGATSVLAFTITDSGIGIPEEKQMVIFEAFQQADGSTSRKYGGTGLGLSISREISKLLGGEIHLVSRPSEGSTFTLYLPLNTELTNSDGTPAIDTGNGGGSNGMRSHALTEVQKLSSRYSVVSEDPSPQFSLRVREEISDDRGEIQSGDRVLLIIEDDVHFAHVLLDMAREQGFKVVIALRSETGLTLARELKPAAIILDIRLPDADGWTVLDRLKHDPDTRHIPIHIFSGEEVPRRGLQLGAHSYMTKPITSELLTEALNNMRRFADRKVRKLLVIEDDESQRHSIIELVGGGDVETMAVATGQEALTALETGEFDCVVLDLGLPDVRGNELIEQIKQPVRQLNLPVIVYTGRELTREQETELKRFAEVVIVKGERSEEQLLDETALFLHRVQADLPAPQRLILEQLHRIDPLLRGKKVLIVDDDVRNIFALTSILERQEMHVLYAENGHDGIAVLESDPHVDVVLMDVMMPGMDGYQTMQAIRERPVYLDLPIIALTAKAMVGDREKCIDAGASDYITKPVDIEQLFSLLRVWLHH